MRAVPISSLIWLLAVSPAVVAAHLVWRYGVNVPIGDQWRFVAPFLEHTLTGQFSIAELFAQANESRPAFPRLLFLLSAALTEWDTRIEMAMSVALLVWMSLVCWLLLRRWAPGRSWALLVPLLVANVILFSPAQYDGLLWGIPLIGYVTTACLVSGLLLTLRGSSSDRRVWGSVILLSAMATFSYANGFLAWVLLAPALWIRGRSTRQPVHLWLFWGVVLGVCVTVYFWGYAVPARHPSWWIALERPRETVLAYLAYLGGAFAFGTRRFLVASVVGAAVVTLFVAACVWIVAVSRRYGDRTRYLPWVLLALYGFGSGVPLVIGRIGLGGELVLRSHYVMFSAWAVVGTLLLLSSCWLAVSDHDRGSAASMRFAWMTAAVCASLVVLHVLAVPDTMVRVKRAHRDRLIAKALLQFIDHAPDDEIHPFLDSIAAARYVRARTRALRRAGMLPEEDIEWTAHPTGECERGWVDTLTLEQPHMLRVAGWAYLPDAGRPGDAVVLTVQASGAHKAIAMARPQHPRADVSTRFGTPRATLSGWVLSLEWPQSAPVDAWVMDAETMRAHPLCVINDRFSPVPQAFRLR